MRAWAWVVATLGLLASAAAPAAAGLADGAWEAGSSGPSTASHATEAIRNDAIRVGSDPGHLRGVVFPRGTANTFLEATGGGEAHTLRHDGRLSGFFGDDVLIEGYRELDNRTLVNREVTENRELSLVTEVTVPEGNESRFLKTVWVKNVGDVEASPTLYTVTEPNANARDRETTAFDADLEAIVSTNGHGRQAGLGLHACEATTGHAIGTEDQVFDALADDAMPNQSSFTGDSWHATRLPVGTLGPDDVRQLDLVFEANRSNTTFPDPAPACPADRAPPVAFPDPELGTPANATAEAKPGRVVLDWNDTSHLIDPDFRLLRSEGACSGTPATAVDATTDPGIVDLDVDPGQTYCYAVTAFWNGNESAPSATVSATPLPEPDPAVRDVAVQPTGPPLVPSAAPLGGHEVTVTVANLGNHATEADGLPARHGQDSFLLTVLACPQEADPALVEFAKARLALDDCDLVDQAAADPLATDETRTFTATWDASTEAGDFEIVATIDYHRPEQDGTNNRDTADAIAYTGGAGVGGVNGFVVE